LDLRLLVDGVDRGRDRWGQVHAILTDLWTPPTAVA